MLSKEPAMLSGYVMEISFINLPSVIRYTKCVYRKKKKNQMSDQHLEISHVKPEAGLSKEM